MDIERLKVTTQQAGFTERDDPFGLFAEWLADAEKSEINDANAMTLATVDASGMPNARMVLLKDFDEQGFVFYTNYESQKGQEILSAMKAALTFHWKSLRRQVRVRGVVEKVTDQEADDYFNSRPRDSRIGAWASSQSRKLESRFALEKAVTKFTAKYAIGTVPRPPHWSGFRVKPLAIEFWHDRPFRLHDRVRFERAQPQADWTKVKLFP